VTKVLSPVDSIRLGVACGNTRLEVELMLKKQKEIQGEAFGECQNIETPPLGGSVSNDLMGIRHVAKGGTMDDLAFGRADQDEALAEKGSGIGKGHGEGSEERNKRLGTGEGESQREVVGGPQVPYLNDLIVGSQVSGVKGVKGDDGHHKVEFLAIQETDGGDYSNFML